MIDEKKIERIINKAIDKSMESFPSDHPIRDSEDALRTYTLSCAMATAKFVQKEFIKSLWHDASEEPDDEKEIIISMNVGTIEEECVMLIYRKENPSTLFTNGCRKWCYLSDLLPKEGGEGCTD